MWSKKIIKKTFLALLGLSAIPVCVLALPISTSQQNILPFTNDTYYLGTTTPSALEWKGIITKDLTITGTCTGCGGGTTYGATYPVTLTGSNFGLAFGTTTANKWSGLQTLNGGFIDTASSTITSTLTLSPLGTAAGTFLAADPNGKIIATTTPSGGGGTPAGSTGDIQYNNAGAFGGETLVPLANGGTALSNIITTLTTNGTITAMPVASSIIRYQSSTGATIQGIAAPSGAQRIILQSAFLFTAVTLRNQNTSATAANRLELQNGQDLVLQPGTQVELFYNTSDSRWQQADFRSPVGVNNSAATQNIFAVGAGIPTGTNSIIFGTGAISGASYGGNNSIILGTNAGRLATAGGDNIILGDGAGQGLTSGGNNEIFMGLNAGSSTTNGASNLFEGGQSGQNNTTGGTNTCLGSSSCNSLTTGSSNVGLGNAGGGLVTTGSNNISIGTAASPATGNLSNVVAIGNTARPTASNDGEIGSPSTPLNVGINNNSPAYPLDVSGSMNVSGSYLINGVAQNPWLRNGNAGTSFGSDILGTTDYTDFGIYTNSTLVERLTAAGLTGFQQSAPQAVVHAGTFAASVGVPSFASTFSTIAASGYIFGSGDKDYAVYGSTNVAGSPIYSSSAASVHFTEPSTSVFDPTGGSANFIGGGGYTASGYDFSYTVWAIYGGSTLISVGNASVSDTGTDPNDGSTYDVSASWGAPPGATPDGYLLQSGGSNPNSGQYQFVSGTSFDDNNSGWAGSPSYTPIQYYTVGVNYGSGAGATSYRTLNTTSGTFIDDTGPSFVVTDDGTWTSGSTVTPTTAAWPSFIADGNVGIATSSPWTTLSVAGNMALTGKLFDSKGSGGTAGNVLMATAAGTQWVATSTSAASVSNSDGTLTISPTTGAVVASLALAHANTWTGLQQFGGNASSTQITTTGNAYLATSGGSVGIGTTSPYAALSIITGLGTGDALAIGTTTKTLIAGFDNDGHRFTSGYAPVVSSCGTGSGSVVGDDQSGTITTATAAVSCTLTFAKAYRATPTCTVTDNSLVGFADIASISASAVTFGISSALTGGNLYYSCSYHR